MDVLRGLRKAGWIVLETWLPNPATVATLGGTLQLKPTARSPAGSRLT